MSNSEQEFSIPLTQEDTIALQKALEDYKKVSVGEAITSLNEIKFKISGLLSEVEELCSKVIDSVSKGQVNGKDMEKLCFKGILSRISQNPLIQALVMLKDLGFFFKENIYQKLLTFPSEDQETLKKKLLMIEKLFMPPSLTPPMDLSPAQGVQFELQQQLEAHNEGIFSVAISEDREQFATGSRDKTIKIWSLRTFENIRVLKGHDHYVRSVAFLGNKVVSGSYDDTVKIWSGDTCERTLQFHEGPVYTVCVSPSKLLIASGSMDKNVVVYRIDEEKTVRLVGHNDIVSSVDFSPDEREIISGSFDKTIKIWNTETGEPLANVKEHTDAVLCVVYSAVFIVTSSIDKSIILWQKTREQARINLRNIANFKHTGRVESVDIDNNIILSLSKDNSIRVWNTTRMNMIQSLEGHGNNINYIDPMHHGGGLKIVHGEHAVSGGYDGKVRVWRRSN